MKKQKRKEVMNVAVALIEGRKKDVSHGFIHVYDLLENAVKIKTTSR